MKLSICCITYNHQYFIEEALRSFLNQKTVFDYEIIIGDDNSTDDTRKILLEYQKQFPAKVKLLLNTSNMGMMLNFIRTIETCKGKYIAMCDGDDYWTDPYKLQKQVVFLEANPGYAICFHRVYALEEGKELILSDLNTSDKEETYNIKDLACQNLMHTPSVVFRNGLIKEFPVWFADSPVGDYVLHMLNARKGLIKYFPEPMAVYRQNSGMWSGQTKQVRYKKWLTVMSLLLKEDFEEEVQTILRSQWSRVATAYLNSLFPNDLSAFYEEIKMLAKDDASLAYECLTNVYPSFLNSIVESKSFKLARRMSYLKNTVLKL